MLAYLHKKILSISSHRFACCKFLQR